MNGPQQASSLPASGTDLSPKPALLGLEDDLALGFECANPALQIERWGQESTGSTPESH